MELIYLNDDFDVVVDRILNDGELSGCGLTKENVSTTLISFQGDEIASSVFYKKYALRDNDDKIIEYTLDEAKDRWAVAVASVDDHKDVEYFRELYNYFLPAGRQMFALGNKYVEKATLSNCYVTNVEDSIEGIFDSAKRVAKTFSYGGGIGLCIGNLRPNKSIVSNSARYSTGAVSFMELFSLTTGTIGQCVAKGQRVLTEKGLIPIQDVKIGDKVWTKSGFVSVINTFKNGKKKIYKIKDTRGYEIHTSANHIFTTVVNGKIIEKKLSEFTIGDPIVLIPGKNTNSKYVNLEIPKYERKITGGKSSRLKVGYKLPETLDEKLAYILGYSYGDGYVGRDKFNEPTVLSMCCADDYPEIKAQLIEYIKECFCCDVKYRFRKGERASDIMIISKLILHYLQKNNILKQKHDVLELPDKILRSPQSVQMSFVSGYFDADGKCSKKSGYVFNSVCYKFLNQIKMILMSNGVLTRNLIQHREDIGWKNLHGISISGSYFQDIFLSLSVTSVKANLYGRVSHRDINLTPYKSKSFNVNYNKCGFVNNNNYISSNAFDRLKKIGEIPCDEKMLIKSYVNSIDLIGNENTFDIELEDDHLYFCEGFYIHNSGRRAALLLSLPIDHPDVEEFIEIKKDNIDRVKNANISIKITNKFINAVKNDEDFTLYFETKHEKIEKTVKARDLWSKIIVAAHSSAEPGLLFWDNAKNESPSDNYERLQIVATNPCSEILLERGGCCCIASLLLHTFVVNPFQPDAYFDFDLFEQMVKRGVRHLDNIIELNKGKHALEEQEESSRLGRRIGLGVTGLADMLASLGIKYDSDKSLNFMQKLMYKKMITEYEASMYLAKERGSFELFNVEKHFSRGFCERLPERLKNKAKTTGLRNVSISTIAPNGSLSIMAQCSSGCEPIFALSYKRYVKLGTENRKEFIINHQGVSRFFNTTNKTELPDYWVTAHDIDYKFRVKLQGVLQKHIDASISSTINLPSDVSVETVSQIYMDAWKEGLKGITVYREGSREGVLITDDFAKEAGIPDMNSVVHCVNAEGGDKFYVIVSYENQDLTKPYQVFVMNYKRAETDGFVKISNMLIKMLSQNGVCQERIQKYISRSNNSLVKLTRFISLSMKTGNLDKAMNILDEYSFAGTLASKLHCILQKSVDAGKSSCPQCGGLNIKSEEGCFTCLDCNFSKCGG